MRWLRSLGYMAVGAAALLLALFVFVQAQQWLLRWRAERLHSEIVALQLHPGTFADIQRLQKEWGRFAHYEGECTQHHCIYQINLRDFSGFLTLGPGPFYFRPWLYRPYRLLGGRPTVFYAAVSVRDNRMWQVGDGLGMAAFPDWNPEHSYLLGVESTFGTRLFDPHGIYMLSALRRGYWIGRPDGCMGCIAGWINMAPGVSASDLKRITSINFSCVSRRKQCFSRDDLIPSAWLDPTNLDRSNSTYDDSHDCSVPLELLAREAVNIAVAEVVSLTRPVQADGSKSLSARFRILQRLKNADNLEPGREFSAWISPWALISAPSPNALIVPGNRFFLLLRDRRKEQVMPCTLTPYSELALTSVLRGIDDDASTGELYSWKDEARRP